MFFYTVVKKKKFHTKLYSIHETNAATFDINFIFLKEIFYRKIASCIIYYIIFLLFSLKFLG